MFFGHSTVFSDFIIAFYTLFLIIMSIPHTNYTKKIKRLCAPLVCPYLAKHDKLPCVFLNAHSYSTLFKWLLSLRLSLSFSIPLITYIAMITHMVYLFTSNSKKRAQKFAPKHSRTHFYAFSGDFENNLARNLSIFAQQNGIINRDEIRLKSTIKTTF